MQLRTLARAVGLHLLPSSAKQRLAELGGPIRRWEAHRLADAYLISYPKSGRTWLRLMIGRVMQQHYGVTEDDLLELPKLANAAPDAPRVLVWHEGTPHLAKPQELIANKTFARNKTVIFLARDPRDVLVSLHFQMSKRESAKVPSMSDFLHAKAGGAETLIHYYNLWAEQRHLPRRFLPVRYEDLRADTPATLRHVISGLGIPASDEVIAEAVEFAAFDRMREMEQQGALRSHRLSPGDPGDEESFKTRRGQVGGFTDYLSPDDIRYLNDLVDHKLSPLFGYRSAGREPLSF